MVLLDSHVASGFVRRAALQTLESMRRPERADLTVAVASPPMLLFSFILDASSLRCPVSPTLLAANRFQNSYSLEMLWKQRGGSVGG